MLEIIKKEFDKNAYFYVLLIINLISSLFFNNEAFAINIIINIMMIMICRYGELRENRVFFIIGFIIIQGVTSFFVVDPEVEGKYEEYYMLANLFVWLGIIIYCSKRLKENFSIRKIFSIENIEIKLYYLALFFLMLIILMSKAKLGVIPLSIFFLLPIYESIEREKDFRDTILLYTSSIWLYQIISMIILIICGILIFIFILLGIFFTKYIISGIGTDADTDILSVFGCALLSLNTTLCCVIFVWTKELDGNIINLIRDKVIKISRIIFKYIFYILKYGLNIMMIFCLINALIKWEVPDNFFGNWLYLYFTISVLEKIFGLLENMNIYKKWYLIVTDIILYILVIISMGIRIYDYGMSDMRCAWIIILSILGVLNILKYTKYNKYTIVAWISLFVSLAIIGISKNPDILNIFKTIE